MTNETGLQFEEQELTPTSGYAVPQNGGFARASGGTILQSPQAVEQHLQIANAELVRRARDEAYMDCAGLAKMFAKTCGEAGERETSSMFMLLHKEIRSRIGRSDVPQE